MYTRVIGIVVALALAGGAVLAQSPANPAPPSSAPEQVCWKTSDTGDAQTCVPLSVLRATFPQYTAGDVSPLAAEQSRHLETIEAMTSAQRDLAACRASMTTLQRAQLLRSVEAAAPAGMQFDTAAGKYVEKPAAKPEEKPKSGGGL